MQKITPFLWFETGKIGDVAEFHVSVFKDLKGSAKDASECESTVNRINVISGTHLARQRLPR